MKCDIWSHPEFLLSKHLKQVTSSGMHCFDDGNVFKKYRDCLKAALILHDLGKASSYFQRYIRGDTNIHVRLRCHSEISALWTYYYLNVKCDNETMIPLIGYLLVINHHANLDNYLMMCTPKLEESYLEKIHESIDYVNVVSNIKDELPDADNIINDGNFRHLLAIRKNLRRISRRFTESLVTDDISIVFNYLFSIMIFADKQSAIFKRDKPFDVVKTWKSDFVNNYRKLLKPSNSIMDEIRKQSFSSVDFMINQVSPEKRFLSINLPTGSGKTLISLYAALKLRERILYKKKILYCLPYTSIIDQNADVLHRLLKVNNVEPSSEILLKHHHLSSLDYTDEVKTEYPLNQSLWLVETWNSDFVITTFNQLLNAILSNKNRHLKNLQSLTHSIIILDEIQTIPVKYFLLVREMLKIIAEKLDIHFILTTATMPLLFSEENEEIIELAYNKEKMFTSLSRIILMRSHSCSIEEFLEKLLTDIDSDPQKSRLIILNTINASKKVYSFLKQTGEDVIYLSTDIIPIHRLRRIKEIKKESTGKIIVSTQLVEAGVDIDIDVVYRDMAPLDSIFQACGRCNRNSFQQSPSEVRLLELKDDNDKHYWRYIYDQVAVERTKSIIKIDESINESEFFNIAQKYYKELWEIKDHRISEELLKRFKRLQYKWAYEHDDSGDYVGCFKLIEERPVSTLFINIDEVSEASLSYYNRVLNDEESSQFDHRVKLLNAYRKMAPYIISVPSSPIFKDDLNIIDSQQFDLVYDLETGYKRIPKQEDYIL